VPPPVVFVPHRSLPLTPLAVDFAGVRCVRTCRSGFADIELAVVVGCRRSIPHRAVVAVADRGVQDEGMPFERILLDAGQASHLPVFVTVRQ